jgi:hypothetical protein
MNRPVRDVNRDRDGGEGLRQLHRNLTSPQWDLFAPDPDYNFDDLHRPQDDMVEMVDSAKAHYKETWGKSTLGTKVGTVASVALGLAGAATGAIDPVSGMAIASSSSALPYARQGVDALASYRAQKESNPEVHPDTGAPLRKLKIKERVSMGAKWPFTAPGDDWKNDPRLRGSSGPKDQGF